MQRSWTQVADARAFPLGRQICSIIWLNWRDISTAELRKCPSSTTAATKLKKAIVHYYLDGEIDREKK